LASAKNKKMGDVPGTGVSGYGYGSESVLKNETEIPPLASPQN
jgi:hypothetical protein